ncbi:AEC family transporter [uncultured Actinomyces sp.]|uniref:AEC family transporter n=1 Tax=uncultured Actinomyces sp. TaxID=249061 RepID=UPI0028DBECC7|nr:AEC family transporter [uncultured Actinomyces sp.]
MGEVLGGLGVFGVVIAVGWVLGRTGAVPVGSDRVLTRIAFWAATPALLATTLGRADLGAVASGRTAAVVCTELVAVTGAALLQRLVLRRPAADAVIGALACSYVNAANLGIPVALLVLGDTTPVAAVLLLQLLVITPVSFALLDWVTAGPGQGGTGAVPGAPGSGGALGGTGTQPGERRSARPGTWSSRRARLTAPARNPLLVGVLSGVLVNVAGVDLEHLGGGHVQAVLDLLGRTAVPLMMLALGLSLADSRASRRGGVVVPPASAGPGREPGPSGEAPGPPGSAAHSSDATGLSGSAAHVPDAAGLPGAAPAPAPAPPAPGQAGDGGGAAYSGRRGRHGTSSGELEGRRTGPGRPNGYGRPVRGPEELALWCAVGWKLLVCPLLAVLVGSLLGLRGAELLVPVTTASLPTAQNVFMYASRYERGVSLARDAVLLTTAGFVPVVLLATALLR